MLSLCLKRENQLNAFHLTHIDTFSFDFSTFAIGTRETKRGVIVVFISVHVAFAEYMTTKQCPNEWKLSWSNFSQIKENIF